MKGQYMYQHSLLCACYVCAMYYIQHTGNTVPSSHQCVDALWQVTVGQDYRGWDTPTLSHTECSLQPQVPCSIPLCYSLRYTIVTLSTASEQLIPHALYHNYSTTVVQGVPLDLNLWSKLSTLHRPPGGAVAPALWGIQTHGRESQ